jgi:hypothetical protein
LDLDPVRTALENNAAMMFSAGADTKIQTEEVAASVAKGDPDPIGSTAFLRAVPPETSVLTREAFTKGFGRIQSNQSLSNWASAEGDSARSACVLKFQFHLEVTGPNLRQVSANPNFL